MSPCCDTRTSGRHTSGVRPGGENEDGFPAYINEDGFPAYITVLDDHSHKGLSWMRLRAAARATSQHAQVLFVVDEQAISDRHPIQVVDLGLEAHLPFRCAAAELWSVDNNLNLANMDWADFASAVDIDGVYRGFE